jgi:HAD superfamily hydrolase (TIGR01509 family)
MIPAALRAVLFDWDGTLVDSAEASFTAYVEAFGVCGIHFDREDYERTYSPNWHRTYEAMALPRERWADVDAAWLTCFGRHVNELLPGAREVLLRLRESALVLGLVTSGERSRVVPELRRLGVDEYFQVVVCGDDTERRKPHPDPLLAALARLDVAPARAVYVGDSPEDVEMARSAGVVAIGVPGGFPNRPALVASRPDLMVDDLAGAARLLG